MVQIKRGSPFGIQFSVRTGKTQSTISDPLVVSFSVSSRMTVRSFILVIVIDIDFARVRLGHPETHTRYQTDSHFFGNNIFGS